MYIISTSPHVFHNTFWCLFPSRIWCLGSIHAHCIGHNYVYTTFGVEFEKQELALLVVLSTYIPFRVWTRIKIPYSLMYNMTCVYGSWSVGDELAFYSQRNALKVGYNLVRILPAWAHWNEWLKIQFFHIIFIPMPTEKRHPTKINRFCS